MRSIATSAGRPKAFNKGSASGFGFVVRVTRKSPHCCSPAITFSRVCNDPAADLRLPDTQPGFIRQYFQAGVLEYHAGDSHQPVKLALLGDAVRDRRYPDQAYTTYASFRSADPLVAGQTYTPEAIWPAG